MSKNYQSLKTFKQNMKMIPRRELCRMSLYDIKIHKIYKIPIPTNIHPSIIDILEMSRIIFR